MNCCGMNNAVPSVGIEVKQTSSSTLSSGDLLDMLKVCIGDRIRKDFENDNSGLVTDIQVSFSAVDEHQTTAKISYWVVDLEAKKKKDIEKFYTDYTFLTPKELAFWALIVEKKKEEDQAYLSCVQFSLNPEQSIRRVVREELRRQSRLDRQRARYYAHYYGRGCCCRRRCC